ncbi:hypothetical protein NW760_004214 [Fusarium oxysporum]|nr:hypothetical protein NW760_004214 [Fusarium oxysporum]
MHRVSGKKPYDLYPKLEKNLVFMSFRGPLVPMLKHVELAVADQVRNELLQLVQLAGSPV